MKPQLTEPLTSHMWHSQLTCGTHRPTQNIHNIAYSQISVTRRADPEADSPRHCILTVESLQLRAEQVAGEAEAAVLLVEDGDQVVRDAVAVGVCRKERRWGGGGGGWGRGRGKGGSK